MNNKQDMIKIVLECLKCDFFVRLICPVHSYVDHVTLLYFRFQCREVVSICLKS